MGTPPQKRIGSTRVGARASCSAEIEKKTLLADCIDETGCSLEPKRLEHNMNRYLELFRKPSAIPEVNHLRKINWGLLPLHWQPLFFKDMSIVVSRATTLAAQRRLVGMLKLTEEDEKRTVAFLRDLTNLT